MKTYTTRLRADQVERIRALAEEEGVSLGAALDKVLGLTPPKGDTGGDDDSAPDSAREREPDDGDGEPDDEDCEDGGDDEETIERNVRRDVLRAHMTGTKHADRDPDFIDPEKAVAAAERSVQQGDDEVPANRKGGKPSPLAAANLKAWARSRPNDGHPSRGRSR